MMTKFNELEQNEVMKSNEVIEPNYVNKGGSAVESASHSHTDVMELSLKKPIKLIVSDVDGTLVNRDKYVTERTIAAVQAAMEQGITVAVASGRAWGEMSEVKRKLPRITHYICSNGAVVLERVDADSTRTVFHQSFSNAAALELMDALIPFDVYIEAYCGEAIYGDREEMTEFASQLDPHLLPLIQASRIMVDGLRDYIESTGIELEKIQIFYGTEEKKQAILQHFKGQTEFNIIESSEGNLEFVQPGISKGRAVASLATSLGITAEEVMCIGDSNNDISMLQYTPVSFAMGNGELTAKAAATYEAPTNEAEGVAVAIESVIKASL
ncbi:MAG: HAD family hydrolase [Veillonella caviae]|nr:HAD family hydrolase [Veillonella caviae]